MLSLLKKIIEINNTSFIWYLITVAAIIAIDYANNGIITDIGIKTDYLVGFVAVSSLLTILHNLHNIILKIRYDTKTIAQIVVVVVALVGWLISLLNSVQITFSMLSESGYVPYLPAGLLIILYLLSLGAVYKEK